MPNIPFQARVALLGLSASALLATTVAFPAHPSPAGLTARYYSADDPAFDFVFSVLESADLTVGLAGHTAKWEVRLNGGPSVASSRNEFIRLVRGVPERRLAVIGLEKNFSDQSQPSSDLVAEAALAEAGFRWVVVYSSASMGVFIDRIRRVGSSDTPARPAS